MTLLILFIITATYIYAKYDFAPTKLSTCWEENENNNNRTIPYKVVPVIFVVTMILKLLWLATFNPIGIIITLILIMFIPYIVIILWNILRGIINSFNKVLSGILFINLNQLENNNFLLNKIFQTILITSLFLSMITINNNILHLLLSAVIFLPVLLLAIIFCVIIYKSYLKYMLKWHYKTFKLEQNEQMTYKIKEALKSNNIQKMISVIKDINDNYSYL